MIIDEHTQINNHNKGLVVSLDDSLNKLINTMLKNSVVYS